MGRPVPTVLMSQVSTGRDLQVLVADRTYAVWYDDHPINLRFGDPCFWKYPRVGYSNPAHACRRAAQLNKTFLTERFHCQGGWQPDQTVTGGPLYVLKPWRQYRARYIALHPST
jgi:hypothetical protein